MNDQPAPGSPLLIRTIGPKALTLGIINVIVGGGIFALPGLVAAELGSAAILAYVACAVGVGLVFLCFAEIGSRVSRSGGAYAYVEWAFGDAAGFVCMVVLWFGWSVFSNAAITSALVDTLSVAFPALDHGVVRGAFIVVLIGILSWVNIRGVKHGVRLFTVTTVIKLVPLVGLLIFGVFAMQAENLHLGSMPSMQKIGAGAVILFFAFAGGESALSVTGEMKEPNRTVPLGLFFGFTTVLILYAGLQMVAQGTLGSGLALETEAPLAAAAERVFGSWGGKLLLAAGAISIFSTISSEMLNIPRVLFASARDRNLPGILAQTHPRFHTPHWAIAFSGMAVATFAISGGFELLATLASGSILLVYFFVSLSVLRARKKEGMPQEGEFTLPGGPVIPILSMGLIAWLFFQLNRNEVLAIAVLVALAVAAYGVKWKLGRRSAN